MIWIVGLLKIGIFILGIVVLVCLYVLIEFMRTNKSDTFRYIRIGFSRIRNVKSKINWVLFSEMYNALGEFRVTTTTIENCGTKSTVITTENYVGGEWSCIDTLKIPSINGKRNNKAIAERVTHAETVARNSRYDVARKQRIEHSKKIRKM